MRTAENGVMSYRFTFSIPPPEDGDVWGPDAGRNLIGQEMEVGTVSGTITGKIVQTHVLDPTSLLVTIEHEDEMPDGLAWRSKT